MVLMGDGAQMGGTVTLNTASNNYELLQNDAERQKTFVSKVIHCLNLQHYVSRGHHDEINMLAATPEMYFIASASRDCTVKVWYHDVIGETEGFTTVYGRRPTYSYRLLHSLRHESSCTAVDFLEGSLTLISGTDNGHIYLWGISHELCIKKFLSKKQTDEQGEGIHRIHHIATAKDGAGGWKIVIGCADLHAHLLAVEASDDHLDWKVTYIHSMEHQASPNAQAEGVLDVKHITPADADGAAFATCTESAVYLWTKKGDLLTTLQLADPEHPLNTLCMTDNGSLLFAGGGKKGSKDGSLNVWGFSKGHLVDENGAKVDLKTADVEGQEPPVGPKPLVTYLRRVLACAVHHPGCVVTAREDGSCPLLTCKPNDGDEKRACPHGPGAALVASDEETIKQTIRHVRLVSTIKAFNDPRSETGSEVLGSGCENGHVFLWDVSGSDAGECIASLRSLTIVELFGPMVDRILTFIQLSTFAFSTHSGWRKDVVAPAVITHEIACFNFHMAFDFDKQVIFWTKTLGVVGLMMYFIITAVFDMFHQMKKFTSFLQSTDRFQKEKRDAKKCGIVHLMLSAARGVRSSIDVLMKIIASACVVPITKTLVMAFHCRMTPEGDYVLRAYTDVHCFQHWHLYLLMVLIPTALVFYPILIPYALVGGDPMYIQRHELMDVQAWRTNAFRKVSSLFLGPMHKNAETGFQISLVELGGKVLMPILASELQFDSRVEMAALFTVTLLQLIAFVRWPPLVDNRYNIFMCMLKSLSVSCMAMGFYSATIQDPSANGPLKGLLVCWFSIVLGAIFLIFRSVNFKADVFHRNQADLSQLHKEGEWHKSDTSLGPVLTELHKTSLRGSYKELPQEEEDVLQGA